MRLATRERRVHLEIKRNPWSTRPSAISSTQKNPASSSGSCGAAPSVGRTIAADDESGGLQLGHAELVEQLVIGAVSADRGKRVGESLREQLVAEGEGDVGAGD